MATKVKSEKKQHIQVFARVRPLSQQELRSQIVVECLNAKEVSVRDKNQTKTFTFDKVFGPDSKQIEVYKTVVGPLIAEVLQGYNCTVFAYGQTGTGKTYTMVGEKHSSPNKNWEEDPNCGVIPRTLSNLFDELKVRADEFTVRVSFLELYNEELCDLLAPADSEDAKSLRLFEDSMKKGSVIVSCLEERTVHNKDDVYAILEAGNLKRQTAPTLMNAQSSRSHTIFTITVHIKVTTPEGEDLIKTGKLNLVDLAGSENIGRSGAVEMRAREAGSINQSLLTLGRVITALVERKPHIPYRESKLTRILQDSLGGRTKTSIIATVSPALLNIEETLSTFEYAHRARNITNKPEINQKTSKRVLLKEYTEEIERLRRDLMATREKHGVYLASENYNAIMAERENLNKELISKLQLLKVREEELARQEDIMKNLNINLYATQNELAVTNQKLQEATKLCTEKEDMLAELGIQTNVLIQTADEAVNDAKTLHDRLARSRLIMEHNFFSAEKFKNSFCWSLNNMKTRTRKFQAKGISDIDCQMDADRKFINTLLHNQLEIKEMTSKVVKETSDQIKSIIDVMSFQSNSHEAFLKEQLTALKSAVDIHNESAHLIISNLIDFSMQVKPKWSNLFDELEKNRKILEKLKTDGEAAQERLSDLIKILSGLPELFAAKLKRREEALKSYAEKCDFLAKKQSAVRKQVKDFGHALYNMAREHLELLQKENECEEALKTVINDRKTEEETILNDMAETVQGKAAEIRGLAEEAGKLTEKATESGGQVARTFREYIIPSAKIVLGDEENCLTAMKVMVEECSAESAVKLNKMNDVWEGEMKKIAAYPQTLENKTNEIDRGIRLYHTDMDAKMTAEKIFVEDNLKESLLKFKNLYKDIVEQSDELCISINDRLKEIDTFFAEDMKKDEKTGNTPQRKEFKYSRRIMGFLKKSKMDDGEPQNNIIEGSNENSNGAVPNYDFPDP